MDFSKEELTTLLQALAEYNDRIADEAKLPFPIRSEDENKQLIARISKLESKLAIAKFFAN